MLHKNVPHYWTGHTKKFSDGKFYALWHVTSECKSFSCVWCFATPQTAAHQAPQFIGFPRPEYWSELSFPSPEDLPNPGIESRPLALQTDSLLLSHQGSPSWSIRHLLKPSVVPFSWGILFHGGGIIWGFLSLCQYALSTLPAPSCGRILLKCLIN